MILLIFLETNSECRGLRYLRSSESWISTWP